MKKIDTNFFIEQISSEESINNKDFFSSIKNSIQYMSTAMHTLIKNQSKDKKKSNIYTFAEEVNIFKIINFKNISSKTISRIGFIKKKTHSFYIAPPFYFSLVSSITTAAILVAAVQFFHKEVIFDYFKTNVIFFIISTVFWIVNLSKQGASSIKYTSIAQKNIVTGIILFIISEIIIFFGMFWSYFHSALAPSSEIGGIWPPYGLEVLEWWKWPTLGTFILVYSGFSVNVFFYSIKSINVKSYFNSAYNSLITHNNFETIIKVNEVKRNIFFPVKFISNNKFINQFFVQWSIIFSALAHTLIFGFVFLVCQKHEYAHAKYSASDGIYGTVFFGITGLHGLHVFLGFILLLAIFCRLFFGSFFETKPHVSVSGAVWYWHFVDIVWIFVYVIVYFWGSRGSIEHINS